MDTAGPVLQLVDSHCHLDFAKFDPDRDEVLVIVSRTGSVPSTVA